jgi:hypothetical protein
VTTEVTAAMLKQLPVALQHKLHQAALNLDIEETEMIIAQIDAIAPAIAAGLTELVEHYQFEQLIKLTTPLMEP